MSLVTEELQYRKGGKVLLHPLNKTFQRGTLYALLGKNGSGKTTLLKVLAGLLSHSSGKIFWNNRNLQSTKRKERSSLVSFVPHAPLLPFDFSVREVVKMGGYCLDLSPINLEERVDRALSLVGMEGLQKRPITETSAGECARAYIARALVTDAPLLLLDEPTSSLDLIQCQAIWELLVELKGRGKAILVATHDLEGCSLYCDEALFMREGRCRERGARLDKEQLKEEYFR